MKLWITFCVFCLAYQTALGQLKGTYTVSYYGSGAKTIHFLIGNNFQYIHVDCLWGETGEGTYVLQNNELVLKFEKGTTKKPYFRTTTKPLKNQTSKLHITALEHNRRDTLLGASIILKDKNGQIYKEQTLGLEGFVEINLPASAETFYLEINAIGCEPLAYPIIPQQDYQIEAILFWNFDKNIEAGKQMKFDIKVYEQYIELKDKSYSKASFERFEKQKE